MAIAEHIGYDVTGRADKDEFPDILKAWQEFRNTNKTDFFLKVPLCFAIGQNELDDAFNPLRFTLRAPQGDKWLRIKDMGSIIYETYDPQKNAPEEEFDWIRIDDLENDPIEVTTLRRVKGKEIKGVVQLLQEGDILIARLGPSIVNKKFIIVPQTDKQAVGSTEFIVLRPGENCGLNFALGVFKTDFYTNLMLSKGRGGTPSRYRLSRSDFSVLPFPSVNIESQQKIGMQLKDQWRRAKKLKEEANELLGRTKREVEELINEK